MPDLPAGATDLLGPPYVVERIDLPDDDEGPVVAHLVYRWVDPGQPQDRAVLHVHGFNDYFFHTEYADWWVARGYDFYAVDLRKFGRSLLPHQTPCYTDDIAAYFPELDAAWQRITDGHGHTQVIASAHSTGGLTLPLWLSRRRDEFATYLAGVVLNSPWIDAHGPFWMRTIGTRLVGQVGARQPRRELPRTVSGVYGHTLHRDFEGEWDYDLAWKRPESWPVYAGWFRAVSRAQRELHRGVDLGAPILVLTSDRTTNPTEVDDDARSSDIVLDVVQIRRWAPMLGPLLTLAAIPGALHDVTLSRPEVRAQVYAELDRWHHTYAGSSRPDRS